MQTKNDRFLRILKQAGLRLTPQRRAICAWLAATDHHPSAYDLCEKLALTRPEISRATVYNTLNALQKLGAIVEISFGSDQIHYDTNPEPHVNLICLRCHTIIDFHGDSDVNLLGERVLHETGFQTAAAKIDLVGFCVVCRTQRLTEIRELAGQPAHKQSD